MATQSNNECDCCDRNKPCGEIFCDCCGESWRNDKQGSETCHCNCSNCSELLRDCRYSCQDEESDDEDENEAEWEGVYGVKTVFKTTLTMAAGRNWWNYIVEYDHGKHTVFIENKNGINKCVGKKLIGGHPDEGVRLVDEDYECGDEESLWGCDD